MIERKFTFHGKTIELPKDLKIYQKSGYKWESVIDIVSKKEVSKEKEKKKEKQDTYVLNPLTFLSFITNYEINNDSKKLLKKDGVFKDYKDKNLTLLVTSNIGLGQWYELFQQAKENNVKLSISLAPNLLVMM